MGNGMGHIGWGVVGLVLGAAVTAAGFVVSGGDKGKESAIQAPAAESAADSERVAALWGTLAGDPASPVIGNPNGDVTIVEFFDYACAYCKAAEPRLAAAVRADPNVRLVLKEFPILTPESMIATRVALAAQKQGKYAQFHQAMMAYQGQLGESAIFDTAQAQGLDMARLKTDMQAPDIHHRHVSHLYALYPSAQIDSRATPELAAAARRSLEIRGDEATGWATAPVADRSRRLPPAPQSCQPGRR